MFKRNYLLFIFLFLYLVLGLLTIFFFDGTGDAGDSVMHYLLARYAPRHPELFFNHWAKPVYVLLVSPFAQLGLNGVKLFNLLALMLTIIFTYLSARILKISNSNIVPVFIIFAPYVFAQTFSGLTEPLFALFLVVGIYLVLKDKPMPAAIVISFLPFVRSEGLIIIGVFALYFIFKKNWSNLLWLLCGHVCYSLAGYFVNHDLLWVFRKIPYASLASPYGSGSIFHFVYQLFYVLGVPVFILFLLGVVSYLPRWTAKNHNKIAENYFLILGCAITFIVAHSIFWKFGIFNSMGLKRVLIGIIPLLALIALQGFNLISEKIFSSRPLKLAVQLIVVAHILIFPFTGNPAALNINKELSLDKGQQKVWEVASFVNKNFASRGKMVYAYPYFSVTFDMDHFDKAKHLELNRDALHSLHAGDLVLWDDWFAYKTLDISPEFLENTPGIKKIKEFYAEGASSATFILFECK